MDTLKEILKNIPKLPWVYQYINKNWKIIYIWKSVNLHARVHSYFNPNNTLNFAKKKMVSEIFHIEILVTNTAIESLLLETTLIKKHQPKYNILMKDDKSHTYIKITDEIFPKIIKTRIKSKSWEYFGPYISTHNVNNIIKITKKIFWHRSCNIVFEGQKIKSANGSKIPCIDYYIGRCSGPCLLKDENMQKYNEDILNIRHFLHGNFEKVTENLKIKMLQYAKNLDFEKAQELKEDLTSLESLKQNQMVQDIIGKDVDIINFLEKYDKFYISKIEVRNEKISGIYNFEIENKLGDRDESIKFFIENNYLENTQKLSLILPRNIDIEKEILTELKLKIEIPKIWEKTDILWLAYKNAFEFAYKKHMEWLSVQWFTKKDMTELLSLLWYISINKEIIFECNDISHISGNHTVASRSILENGKINTSKYKKFKIKTLSVGEINDFDSMREIMKRRLLEIKKTWYIPDLIIIDGGKWQLSSVMQIIEDEKKNKSHHLSLSAEEESYFNNIHSLQIVSLAKREEELFLPGKKESILIDKESNILRMIQKIRDEAHRFAITFNRDTRIKASKKNILEELPGIWPKTRKKLLKEYGSIENIINNEILKKILSSTQIETLENHGIL